MKAAALLAAISALLYLPSLAAPFHFDDYNVIAHYPVVHSWSAWLEHGLPGIRPLLKATYTLNWTLDPHPLGFHALNIALHAANAALLCWIGMRTIDESPRNFNRGQSEVIHWTLTPIVAAALFALHPMQTEAVTYVSGRSSVLMATFYLLAVLSYLANRPWPLTALAFLLALASKETAVTLPAALLLIELCRGTPWRAIVRKQAPYWFLLAAAGGLVFFHGRYLELLAYGFSERGIAENLRAQVGGVSYLVWHLVTLQGVNIDPALPTPMEWTPALALQAALLGALLCLGIGSLRRRPWLAFGILWFFLHLAPTNSIVPRLDIANDRQVYLACWGLFFALAVQVSHLSIPAAGLRAAAAAIAVLFAAGNVARQLDYADEVSLWEAAVREAPWNARAHNNLGYAYYEAGRMADARRHFETALLLDPRETKARANLVLLERLK